MKRLAQIQSLLHRLGLAGAVCGVAGLLAHAWLDLAAVLPISLFALLVGALCFSFETIIKREETVSRGDDIRHSSVYGFQAMAMGFSNAVFALAALVAVVAWLMGLGSDLAAWTGDHPGAPMAIGGLWLASSQVGAIVGVALSALDASEDTLADRTLNTVNTFVEKLVAVILSLAGLAFLVLGLVALVNGWGLADMLGHLLP